MLVLMLCLFVIGGLWTLYAVIKRQGRQQVINKSYKEASRNENAVRKRDIKRNNQPMDDVIDELHQDTRD